MTQFPFSAVVGMADMRLALLLNAVSPAIGGVLVRGEKGTAKSTAVRALTSVLPSVAVIDGCRFGCAPAAPDPQCPDGPHAADAPSSTRPTRLVELPVGATEDRLTGSLDVEAALTQGVTLFRPGLLAGAHRGVLYVDEVNLLHDHLVDLLLDAAALGTSYVERDGVSVRHAARFLLVGTMNPEEGELRPQLLDRFGLTVEVAAPRESAARAEVVRRRMAHDDDPVAFAARFAADESALAQQIATARAALPGVTLPDAELTRIADVCAAFDVDGLRADIVMARTAIAHAAWCGRDTVDAADVRVAAQLALPHRRRRNPFDAPGLDDQQLDDALGEPEQPDDDPPPPSPGTVASPNPRQTVHVNRSTRTRPGNPGTVTSLPAPALRPRPPPVTRSAPVASRHPASGTARPGDARAPRRPPDASWGPAPRRPGAPAAPDRHPRRRGPHQHTRGRRAAGLLLTGDDLRDSRVEGRESNLVLFLVDASGSMAARSRMSAVKGAVLSLLLDAYQRRDKVGMIAFRGTGAELLLPPTSSVEAGAARLTSLPTGGRTPLEAGLLEAHDVLRREHLRDPQRRALLVIVTDGRNTSGADPARAAALLTGVASVVVDCETGPVRLGLAGALAEQLGGTVLRLEELAAGTLAGVVRDFRKAA